MEILEQGQYGEYLAFLEAQGAHFMQTPFWAGVKPGWGCDILVQREEGEICAGVLLLRRKISGTPYCMLYAPRGPVCPAGRLEELLAEVIQYARKCRACCLKIDPYVSAENAEYDARLRGMGFLQMKPGRMGNTQPKFLYQIDIAGKDPAQILQGFTPKTRYNTRVAERRGVRVAQGGSERVAEFYRLLLQTGRRDGFAVRQEAYYRNLLEQMGSHAQLFFAEIEGKPIAGAIAIWFGRRVWYLYGASGQEHREAMPNYLMQYRMMLWAAEKGCEVYDMRGISGDFSQDNPLYGLYRFKKGFGGRVEELLGEYELAVNRSVYALYRVAMAARRRYKQRALEKFKRGAPRPEAAGEKKEARTKKLS